MTQVEIDLDLEDEAKRFIEENSLDYPSYKNFINKAVREKLLALGRVLPPQKNKKKPNGKKEKRGN